MNNSEAQPIETSFFANNIFYKWALFLFTYNQVKTKTIWQHQTLDLFMPFHPKITSQKTVKFGLFEKHTHFEKMLLMVLTLLSKSADLSKPWGRFFQILWVSQKVRTLNRSDLKWRNQFIIFAMWLKYEGMHFYIT